MDNHILLKGKFIKLGALLKLSGAAMSGGDAKEKILSGTVFVNGSLTLERGKKIYAGDVVEVDGEKIVIDGETH